MAEFNIVGSKYDPSCDYKLFTSVEEDEKGVKPDLIFLEETDKTMAHLLAKIGKFKSVGEAKRNGWDKLIPTGWTEFNIGKAKNRVDIFIWNPMNTLQEFVDQMID